MVLLNFYRHFRRSGYSRRRALATTWRRTFTPSPLPFTPKKGIPHEQPAQSEEARRARS